MPLAIRDLVTVTDGRLSMSSLPPLGGPLEPIDGIQFDSRHCTKGSLFWSLSGIVNDPPPWAPCSNEAFADHAFANGALGVVVSGRPIEPWAGGFAVQVDDNATALRRFAAWNRKRFLGPIVVAIDDEDGGLTTLCQSVVKQQGHLGAFHEAHDDWAVHTFFAQLDDSRPYSIITIRPSVVFSTDSPILKISHLCCPDIAVITPLAFEKTLHNAFHKSPRDEAGDQASVWSQMIATARAVVLPSEKLTDAIRSEIQGEIVSYGCEQGSDVQAEQVKQTARALQFRVAGNEYQLNRYSDTSLSQGLATVALCDYLKITNTDVQAALSNPQAASMAS